MGEKERVDDVVDEQDVAHLPAVAVDGQRLVAERRDEEVRDPALILGAELARAIDAAHPQHRRRDGVDPGVVQHVLVGGALRAAVGAVEVERQALVEAVGEPAERLGAPRRRLQLRRGFQVAVDLVGGGEDQRDRRSRRRRMASSTFKVPPALTAKSLRGSARLVVTATCAARWTTRLARATTSCTAYASRTSPLTKLTRAPWRPMSQSTFSSTWSRARASKMITCSPARARRSAMLVPMKPAPPVISTPGLALRTCAGPSVRLTASAPSGPRASAR